MYLDYIYIYYSVYIKNIGYIFKDTYLYIYTHIYIFNKDTGYNRAGERTNEHTLRRSEILRSSLLVSEETLPRKVINSQGGDVTQLVPREAEARVDGGLLYPTGQVTKPSL